MSYEILKKKYARFKPVLVRWENLEALDIPLGGERFLSLSWRNTIGTRLSYLDMSKDPYARQEIIKEWKGQRLDPSMAEVAIDNFLKGNK